MVTAIVCFYGYIRKLARYRYVGNEIFAFVSTVVTVPCESIVTTAVKSTFQGDYFFIDLSSRNAHNEKNQFIISYSTQTAFIDTPFAKLTFEANMEFLHTRLSTCMTSSKILLPC